MFTLGAETLPYHDYSLDVSLRELAELGFSHVNLWTSAAPLAHHINPGDDIADIKRQLRKYSITPTGLTMYGKTQDEMRQRIEMAAELGIPYVVFDCEEHYPDFVSRFLPPLLNVCERTGVRIAVENHLTVPFTADFESGGHEAERWDEGVDSLAQIKRLITDIDSPYLGVCVAPPHLWVMQETISGVVSFLMERKKLFFYYLWDIDHAYERGKDGLDFGPGEQQLPRPDGTLDFKVLLANLAAVGYEGVASMKCHGTHGWPLEYVTGQLRAATEYLRGCVPSAQQQSAGSWIRTMRFALMIEPQQGIAWRQQVAITQRAEAAAFDTLYRSDHYQSFPGPSGRETSDGWAVIAGLVRETSAIRHGTLVSPVTFRHPGNLAKVVSTIDHMSDGRVELGLGAAWHLDEHRRHGFAFPDLATRLEMLEEQLELISGLWSEPAGWSFHGRHYTVEDSLFALPPVQQPRPPLIVGTRGAARGVRIAARFADELNLYYCGAVTARRVFEMLDAECRAIGREPSTVVRSVLLGTIVGEDRPQTDERLAAMRATFEYPGDAASWAAENGDVWIVGTPDEAARRIGEFEAAGAEKVVFQDFLPDDLEMVDLLGSLTTAWTGG